ncbi:MAG: hypothetical protein RIF41_40965, partial [Polyangiaceae bacterium]
AGVHPRFESPHPVDEDDTLVGCRVTGRRDRTPVRVTDFDLVIYLLVWLIIHGGERRLVTVVDLPGVDPYPKIAEE